jgi:hypothetical protein
MHEAPSRHLTCALAAVALWGCTGTIAGGVDPGTRTGPPGRQGDEGGAGAIGGTGGGVSGDRGGAGGGGPGPASAKLPVGGVRRLTVQQYANSVRDLLGEAITVPPIEPDPSSDDEFVLTSVAVGRVSPSARAVDQYDSAGRAIARQVFGDPARRQALVGCTPAGAADACIARFLSGFGRRVWRRPLTDEELARYQAAVTMVAAGRDVWAGLEAATAALLASPNFVYRIELGAKPGTTGKRQLDDHELATRLSYTLNDTTPDVALLDAAGRGELLARPEVLRAAIERLLASPRARQPLLSFFSEWLGTTGLDSNGLAKDATLYPAATPALARGMYLEIEGLVARLVFDREADLLSLYDTRETFLTAELAQLYGLPAGAVPAGAKASPYTLPAGPRAGLLTTGAFLSLNARASITSPTLRGVFIRERLLCQTVPPPPPDVDTTLPAPPPGAVETMRERLTRHRMNPACDGCHRLMDPLGLALENFDALGAYRTTDAGKTIDPSGDMDGKAFDGPQALQALVRDNPAAATCALRQLVQLFTGTDDAAVADSLATQLEPTWKSGGGRVKAFLQSYLESPLARTVEVAP